MNPFFDGHIVCAVNNMTGDRVIIATMGILAYVAFIGAIESAVWHWVHRKSRFAIPPKSDTLAQ